MASRMDQVGGVILMGMGAWLGYNALPSKPLEHSAEAVRISGWECSECGEAFEDEEGAEECCPCQHKNWEWTDVGSDLSYAEVECLDCDARGMHSLNIIEGWDAESFSADMTSNAGKAAFQPARCPICFAHKPLYQDIKKITHNKSGSWWDTMFCKNCISKKNYRAESFGAEAQAVIIKGKNRRGLPEDRAHIIGQMEKDDFTPTTIINTDTGNMEGIGRIPLGDKFANHRKFAESFSADHDAKGYYEPYAFCEFCSDEIQKEGDGVTLRGEIICKPCKEAWDEQPDDGGFWAEGEDSRWSDKDFRAAANEIAWGEMEGREPFDDEETMDQLHRYSQQAYGFEELSAFVRREIYQAGEPCDCNDNDPDFMCYTCEVLEIIDNKDYEAEGHKMMADNFMPPSMLWTEEDDEADEDAVTYFTENLINEEFLAEYMADPSGTGSSRFMKTTEVEDLFRKAKGTLVSVTFVKRTNGEVRKMLCRTSVKKGVKGVGLKFNPKNRNLIGVYDFQKVREGADPWKCYRFVPIDAVLSMRVRGKTYTA